MMMVITIIIVIYPVTISTIKRQFVSFNAFKPSITIVITKGLIITTIIMVVITTTITITITTITTITTIIA